MPIKLSQSLTFAIHILLQNSQNYHMCKYVLWHFENVRICNFNLCLIKYFSKTFGI